MKQNHTVIGFFAFGKNFGVIDHKNNNDQLIIRVTDAFESITFSEKIFKSKLDSNDGFDNEEIKIFAKPHFDRALSVSLHEARAPIIKGDPVISENFYRKLTKQNENFDCGFSAPGNKTIGVYSFGGLHAFLRSTNYGWLTVKFMKGDNFDLIDQHEYLTKNADECVRKFTALVRSLDSNVTRASMFDWKLPESAGDLFNELTAFSHWDSSQDDGLEKNDSPVPTI